MYRRTYSREEFDKGVATGKKGYHMVKAEACIFDPELITCTFVPTKKKAPKRRKK